MKKKFVVTFASLVGLLLSSCSFLNVFKPNVKSIEITNKREGILLGEELQLEVKTLPENAKNTSIVWKSSKEDVASITDEGKLSALKVGSTTVEAISAKKPSIKDNFEINVVESTSIDKTKLSYTYDDYMVHNYYPLDNCPLEGNPKLLIIPIWFSDSNTFIDISKKNEIRNDIQKAYVGTPSDTGWHSIKSYYETESKNKMTLSATVADWYNVGTSYLTYAYKSAQTSSTPELVKTASDYYFSNHLSDNRSNYDSNNDGYLDGVMLIYAAPDNNSIGNSSYENLWAYCNWRQVEPNISSPQPNVFFWASYDFLYGSNAYEKTGKSSYARGYTEYGVTIDTHCFIHEMGHVLGLEDYYDYSGQYIPAGGFSMQDYNVGGHDPYSVMAYGWADPSIPDKSMTISTGDFQSTHDVILLANHSVSNSPFDEYLLLEYYTPTGLNEFDSKHSYREYYPTGPAKGGIRLWHVDARLYSFSTYKLTTDPTEGGIYHAMSNSYGDGSGSPVSPAYDNYNVLQLIRNNKIATYTPKDNLSQSDLFMVGDSFDTSTFRSQFVNGAKMNNGKALGWSFNVVSLSENKAVITLKKA